MDDEKQLEKMNLKLQMISHFPEQIIKMWIIFQQKNQMLLTKCLLNGNNNIKQIINMNLIYFLEKYKKNYGFCNLWKIVDEIDEDTFNYILDNDLYGGIYLCNSVIKNSEYVKKLLDKGYDYILYYIDESVFFELLEDDKYKNRLLNFLKEKFLFGETYQEITFLQSDKVFIYIVNYLCKNTNDLYEKRKILEKLLRNINSEYRTKEKVLAVSLNIGAYLYNRDENNFFNNLLKKNFGDNYYEIDRSETIRRIINLGFIPSNLTIVAHENEYKVFIENNFFQVFDYESIINSNVYPTEDTLILAHKKGCDLSNIYYIKNLLKKYSIANNEINDTLIKFFVFVSADYRFQKYILSKEQINEYFNEEGPKKELYEKALLNSELFNACFNKKKYLNDYITRFNPSDGIKQYIYFVKENDFILNEIISELETINNYFNEEGPIQELYEKALLNSKLFNACFNKEKNLNDYITRFNPSDGIKQYINFVKENGFILENNLNTLENITDFFDEKGLTDFGINKILSDFQIYENLDKYYFKDYYEKNYNIPILNSILIKLDYNYSYLMDFLSNTLNLPLPIKQESEEEIKKIYCLDIIEINGLINIIKYVYFGTIDKKIIGNIIKKKELYKCLKVFNIINIKWDINDFIKFVSNYENNKVLCDNIIDEKDLTNDEKIKLQLILINGYKSAVGVINNREDIANFNTIIYDNNNNIINSNNINDIKKYIFNFLFNIDIVSVNKIQEKYNLGNGLENLKKSINNPKLKEIIEEYEVILNFIFKLYKTSDLEGLKNMAKKLNELVKNNQLSIIFELWDSFSKLDSDIMKICGEEINEKIVNFDELLNMPEENIPIINSEKSYFVRAVNVSNQFEYDGEKIESGTNVKIIELNGLPFVAFGHVLNAFGSGGKLSDFNHPRVIGKTHLCLSAIDDNYYSLVTRDDSTIDHVQVLFTNLPSNSLVIASEKDVGSWTKSNSKEVGGNPGGYLPIRENISITFHGTYGDKLNGYNEYVYYRDGLLPTGILIRGDMPTESEIQAAAYLSRICGKDIPLVKINKEKYQIRSDEEMRQRDKELEDYYKDLYEQRKSDQRIRNVDELKRLRAQLLSLFNNSSGQLEGDSSAKRI